MAQLLTDNGQIAIKPEPNAVLDVLTNNHVLMRAGDAPGYSSSISSFRNGTRLIGLKTGLSPKSLIQPGSRR